MLNVSAVHVTFLWPVIITEMVQVFSYIENQLLADTEEFRYILRGSSLRVWRLSVRVRVRDWRISVQVRLCSVWVWRSSVRA